MTESREKPDPKDGGELLRKDAEQILGSPWFRV